MLNSIVVLLKTPPLPDVPIGGWLVHYQFFFKYSFLLF